MPESVARQKVLFDHIGLNVPDLEEAMDWYCRVFDLTAANIFEVHGTDLRGVMLLHESGYRIELVQRPNSVPGMQPSSAYDAAGTWGYGHFCIAVDDVQQEYDRLIEGGCTMRMVPSPSPRPGAMVSFVADPWGNLVEVISNR